MSTTKKRRVAILATAGAAAMAIAVGFVACSPIATMNASPAPSSTATTCTSFREPENLDRMRDLTTATTVPMILATETPADVLDTARVEHHALKAAQTVVYTQLGVPYAVLTAHLPWDSSATWPVVTIDDDPALEAAHGCEDEYVAMMLPARGGSVDRGDAVSSIVGWVKRADLSELSIETRTVAVDTATNTLTVTDEDGDVLAATDALALGREGEETPTGIGFVAAQYTDPENQPWIGDGVITLTSLHSVASESFNGNNAEVGIHPVVDAEKGNSRGCVRINDSEAAAKIAELIKPGDLVVIK